MQEVITREAAAGRPDQVVHEAEPINEVFFINCGCHSLITALRYFGREVKLFIANATLTYAGNDVPGEVKFKGNYQYEKPEDELLETLSIGANRFFAGQPLTTALIRYLSEGALAIVHVDCFYVAADREFYQKKHLGHSMLVCGYDRTRRLFDIVDNQAMSNCTYKRARISFDELETAHAGFNDTFNARRNYVSFSIISKKEALPAVVYSDGDIRSIAIAGLAKRKDSVPGNDWLLDHVFENFSAVVSDEKRLAANADPLTRVIGEIVIGKKIELYKAVHIFRDPVLAETAREIVFHFEYVRNVLIKMALSQVYPRGSAAKMKEKMKEIVRLEKLYMHQAERLLI
jgi:hypothetical protein